MGTPPLFVVVLPEMKEKGFFFAFQILTVIVDIAGFELAIFTNCVN
jgi:hypothetical protein